MAERSRRRFTGVTLTEQADGSAVLLVRTMTPGHRWLDYEIHLATHVYQDIGFACYQQYHDTRFGRPRMKRPA